MPYWEQNLQATIGGRDQVARDFNITGLDVHIDIDKQTSSCTREEFLGKGTNEISEVKPIYDLFADVYISLYRYFL